MSKQHDRVMAAMNAPVDPYRLAHKQEDPNLHEKLVLQLASALEHHRDPHYCSVSWATQEEAARYFNQHGFVATLNYCLALQAGDVEPVGPVSTTGDER